MIVVVEAKQTQGARIGERGVAKDANSHQPERGGGCAGHREEEGRGSFPNVAIERPVGLVRMFVCLWTNAKVATVYGQSAW